MSDVAAAPENDDVDVFDVICNDVISIIKDSLPREQSFSRHSESTDEANHLLSNCESCDKPAITAAISKALPLFPKFILITAITEDPETDARKKEIKQRELEGESFLNDVCEKLYPKIKKDLENFDKDCVKKVINDSSLPIKEDSFEQMIKKAQGCLATKAKHAIVVLLGHGYKDTGDLAFYKGKKPIKEVMNSLATTFQNSSEDSKMLVVFAECYAHFIDGMDDAGVVKPFLTAKNDATKEDIKYIYFTVNRNPLGKR